MATATATTTATETASNIPSNIASQVGSSNLMLMTSALHGGLNNLLNTGQSILDRFFPPSKRQEFYAKLTEFATEKPKLASFLLSQIAISGIPLALFIVMTIGVFVFSIIAGLLIGLLGALLFTAFCVGIALLVLLPTLFLTTTAAAFVWLWGLGTYYILKWFNQKDVPGIHKPMGDSLKKQFSGGLNGTPLGDQKNEDGGGEKKGAQQQQQQNQQNQKQPRPRSPQQQRRQTTTDIQTIHSRERKLTTPKSPLGFEVGGGDIGRKSDATGMARGVVSNIGL
ncbi:MAG: hypothetical protein M1834_006148 [Cirrosporium novae-zelandiae]|nr:MAG: hypothetical protein M1834_006148 [Cirrosporium novae-zelandiae]